jgi:hypothetical protein
MRSLPALLLGSLLCLPSAAHASPYAFVGFEPAAEPSPAPETVPPGSEPTSSPAPAEGEPVPEPTTEPEPEPEGPQADTVEAIEPQPDVTLEAEREEHAIKGEFNPHGVGARAGLVIIPTWILSGFLASHTNALCRGDVGNFADQRGLLKTEGCNFFVAGEYTYRKSRIFDIVGAIGYQSLHAPDGYWLDTDEWDRDSCELASHVGGPDSCNLGAADYTEIDMNLLTFQADFVARYPVVVTPDIEFGLGGGAGIGLGVIFGGVYQTALGNAPGSRGTGGVIDNSTCTTLDDLKDMRRCTPRYDPDEYSDYHNEEDPDPPTEADLSVDGPNPFLFADCGKDKCDIGDLKAFGYRKEQEDIPPVYPIVNLILSARMIVKDVWGINLTGGFNTGFYFGGSMSYFFAGKK